MNLSTLFGCILLISLNMISCEKEEDEEPQRLIIDTKIAHYLYQNCSKTPYANLDLFFYERHYRGFTDEEKYLGSTTTDANGYFSFDPGYCQSNKDIFVLDANGVQVFATGCLGDAGYSKTDLTAERNTEHVIKILTNKPFSINDTLYLGIRGTGRNRFIKNGPFVNGYFYNSGSVEMLFDPTGYGMAPYGYQANTDVWWGIGKAEFDQVSTNPTFQKPPNLLNDITQVVCGMGDTIVIDLRGY